MIQHGKNPTTERRTILFQVQEFYSSALALVPKDSKHASVYHANSGACHLALGSSKQAVDQCTCALEIDGSYVKALMRRSTAYENLDELEKALDDAKKVGVQALNDLWTALALD